MTSLEKVAYLKGLMEGMELNRDSGEGKLFAVITEILGEMAEDIEDLEGDLFDVRETAQKTANKIVDLEDEIDDLWSCLSDEDDDEYDSLYNDNADDEDDEEEDPQFFEITCPHCDETITVDEDLLMCGRVQCPHCGEMLEFDLFDSDPFDDEDDDLDDLDDLDDMDSLEDDD